jgi:hypothetical protein
MSTECCSTNWLSQSIWYLAEDYGEANASNQIELGLPRKWAQGITQVEMIEESFEPKVNSEAVIEG